MKFISRCIIVSSFVLFLCAEKNYAQDSFQFYKPPLWQGNLPVSWFGYAAPTKNNQWMTSCDVMISRGSTQKAWNADGERTNILHMVGPSNILYIGENTRTSRTLTALTALYPQLLRGRDQGTFGQFSFAGKYSLDNIHMRFRQNLCWGFFLESSFAIHEMKIKNITMEDITPLTGNNGFNQQLLAWRMVKAAFNGILNDYGMEPATKTWAQRGCSDITVRAGWEIVTRPVRDYFMQWNISGGVVIPAASKRSLDHVFALALGNNDHVGLTATSELTVGLIRSLALRLHGGATYFLKEDRLRSHRMKTAAQQQGYLIIAQRASEHKGVAWNAGGDFHVDHLIKGMSMRIGYEYTRQEDSSLLPFNATDESRKIANSDPLLKSWHAHNLHLMAAYDVGNYLKRWSWAPRVSGFATIPLKGKNCYKMMLTGGAVGIDVRWSI